MIIMILDVHTRMRIIKPQWTKRRKKSKKH